LGLAAAGGPQQIVDLLEDCLRLALDRRGAVARHLPGQIDGVAVHDRPAHAGPRVVTVDAHAPASNSPAAPWPPPMHMVTTPNRALRLSISLAMVPTRREPVMPKGWPIEIEPPLTLSFSGSMPRRSRQ